MSWIDFIFAIIIIASIASGFSKGFVRIGIGFVASIAGIVLASWFYGTAAGWLAPYVTSPGVANFLGFLMVFAIVLSIGALVSGVLVRMFKLVGLSWLDRLLGDATLRASYADAGHTRVAEFDIPELQERYESVLMGLIASRRA